MPPGTKNARLWLPYKNKATKEDVMRYLAVVFVMLMAACQAQAGKSKSYDQKLLNFAACHAYYRSGSKAVFGFLNLPKATFTQQELKELVFPT